MSAEELERLRESHDELVAILRDLVLGADVMLQVPTGGAFDKYCREVKRVAQAGIDRVRV